MMMKKTCALLLCLCMLLAVSFACAAVRMPENRGTLTDDANVLSADVSAAINAASESIEKEAKVRLYTVFIHFLDGMDAQQYADTLFQSWQLSENAILFVSAVGEDSCAVSIGTGAATLLGKGNVENLSLTAGLDTALKECRYDDAIAVYLNALTELCNRQTGSKITLNDALTVQKESIPVQGKIKQSDSEFISTMWSGLFQKTENTQQTYAEYEEQQDESNGLSIGEWIVLGILILIIISQSRKPKPPKPHRKGCGCSPIGWLFSLLGIGGLIGHFTEKHR